MSQEEIIRNMPNNLEAEQSVIGSMITDRNAITVASEILTAADFYNKGCSILFETMVELYNDNAVVDLVTLQSRLKDKNVAGELSDMQYLANIAMSVPTTVNVKAYAEIVKEKAILRKLIAVTTDINNNCYSNGDAETVLADAEKKVFEVVKSRTGGQDFTPIKNIVVNVLDNIERATHSNSSVTGIPTGFIDLDTKTAGLQKSDLVLIAARPSMGKTAFVLNVTQDAVLKSNITTAIFSLEMSKEQLVTRLFSLDSGVNSQKIRIGNLNPDEMMSIIETADKIGKSKLIINDTPGISINELRSACRKMKLENDLGLVIIDYLQLMTGNAKTDSRQQEISEISRSLKALAREIDAPVIALSQLSRAVEQRQDHRPMLSDLRESGAIEQDADVVMFIYRDDYYNKDSEKKGVAEIIIAKQRNGPIGTVELAWLPDYTRFANLQK